MNTYTGDATYWLRLALQVSSGATVKEPNRVQGQERLLMSPRITP